MPRCPLHVPLLLAFALAGAPALSQPTQPAGQADLDRGREAVARQDYAGAAAHLKRAVAALDPQHDRAAFADAWLQLGISHLLGGSPPEEALAAFLASAAVAPNPASAYLWAATAAERLGRRDEAELYKARALGAPPAAPKPAPPPPEAEVATRPAPPAEAPAPVPAPPPAPKPAPPEPTPAPPSAPTSAKHQGDKEEKAPEAKPAADGAAFDHFFRRRKGAPAPPPAADPPAAPAEEKPPAS